MAKKILLLDVSHLFFRAFYAFPKSLTDSDKKPINAVFGVAQMLFTAIEKEKPDFVFGGKDLPTKTLRSQKLESYKGQRPELDDDLRQQIPRIYQMLSAMNIPVFAEDGYEADDILASLAEKYRGNNDFEVEILTGDADSFQLIGDNVSVLKPINRENVKYDREKLFDKKNLYPEEIVDFKALAGDSSDNLKGVAGIGEKGATNLIRSYKTLEGIYEAVEAGEIKGAMKRKLEEGKEDAFFTRELAGLYTNLQIHDFEEEKGSLEFFTLENACQFFESIGSQSLQKRAKSIFENTENTSVKNLFAEEEVTQTPQQSSLF